MRKLFFLLIILTILFFASLFVTENSRSSVERSFNSNKEGVSVYFFYGEGCPHCARVEPFIDDIQQTYGLNIRRFEVYGNRSNMMLLDDYFEEYDVPISRRGVPAVFTSTSYIVGDVDILDGFKNLVLDSSRGVVQPVVASGITSKACDTGESGGVDCLSLLTITVAALVDSVNPCSMAILFFLMAGLLLFRKREKALKVGLAFILSVFVANLLFGFGIMTAVGITSFSSMFKVAAGLIAVLTGVLLIKDCFFYGGGGFVLEVPRSLRPYLKHRLSKAFFGKTSSLVGVFLVGFLATSFEVPCTGGPYFYVLARMANEATRMQTLPVLIYYNLIFVMPLILITALLYFGSIHVEKAREWKDRNKPLINLVRSLPLIAIGLITIPTQQMVQTLTIGLNIYRIVFIPTAVVLISHVACQAFSRQKNKGRALKWMVVMGLTATIMTAAITSGQKFHVHASSGCVVIKVQYQDGCPRSNAIVKVVNSTYTYMMGTTDESGLATRCDHDLSPGNYQAKAYWPNAGTQFGYTTPFTVDGNGDGSVTIEKDADYPNGTETCGDSECDGFKYCYAGGPPYVECSSWNTECDTKKCCQCSGGTKANPTQNYDETQDGDCPLGQECVALDTCADIKAPTIVILSPQNTTYNRTSIDLTFTIDEPTSWIGYSLDDQTNATITGNTTLTGLPESPHSIIVYANDTSGNMGNSNKVYFTIDLTPPTIMILSPENKTYYSSSIPLTFETDEPTPWIGYSLDNQPNVTISGNTTIVGVSDGTHQIIIYANDTSGNTGSSNTIQFTVNTTTHDIAVLNVTPSKTIVGEGYSININVTVENQGDNTETFNITLYANTTIINTFTNLTLPNGNSTTITFTWNTTGFAKGNYTIKAVADTVPSETDTTDNTLINGWVFVSIPGDVNADQTVNILDCIMLANHFGHTNGNGHTPSTKEWMACLNSDINCDLKVNILDCIILAGHFGQEWT